MLSRIPITKSGVTLGSTRIACCRVLSRFPQLRSLSTRTKHRTVTLIPGDGIGPEVTCSVVQAFAAMKCPIDWDNHTMGERDRKDRIPKELHDSIIRNGYAIKGPIVGSTKPGVFAPDLMIAREFGLFAHVVPVKNMPGIKTRHDNVDMVVIRENTEGEYSGLEHQINKDNVLSLKVITRKASRAIAEYAFLYALENHRKKVSAVHKANIMKMADGLFLEACREVAGLYRGKIDYEEVIIDNCCMQLVSRPEQFDVVVTGNLYGNIVSESASGLAGGVGLIPGFNIGPNVRIYEQGPRHAGLDIAGMNKANPTSFLLSSCLMLRDMGLGEYAEALENAVRTTIMQGNRDVLTPDFDDCNGTTTGFTQAVIDNMVVPHT